MEKAILIGVQTYTNHSFEERMEEMKELALACDIEILHEYITEFGASS